MSIFGRIRESLETGQPAERWFRVVSYLMIFLAGIIAGIREPETFENALNPLSLWACSVFLLVGGLLGSWAVLTQRYMFERVAIPFSVTGLLIFLLAIWTLELPATWTRYLITAVFIALCSKLFARWFFTTALVQEQLDRPERI
ncbi:hypothetical protein BJD55_gp172 [Gordonia phage Yvonnetastic]|uniref:Uncharacterized protein n=1 Tax=Gordonia phage Yvonnetastic TaxID=1821566 RepID=A0A142K911_9CAUD|nr:hypothetical protein BJD55_gp172 [Gordonia phage Yvonnetastic]AMS02594.1 hypothetical protein SEA_YVONNETASTIC_50 [Gordonia phage Yvonnetastic]